MLTLLVHDANGAFQADLTGYAEDIQLSTQEPGGCLECSFKLPGADKVVPAYIGANYDLRVLDNEGVFWRGRIERPEIVFTERDIFWQITAVGYGSHLDDRIDETENVSNQVTTTIISNATTNHAPLITATSIEASGYSLSAATAITLVDKRVREIINWAAQFGYADLSQMLWHIYPKADVAATLELTVKKRPVSPDYTMYIGQALGTFGFDFANFANRILVLYNAGASVVTRNNTASQGAAPEGVNLIKTAGPVSVPEITQAVDANQVGDVLLTRLSTLRMDALQITIPPGATVLDAKQNAVEHHRVRSGRVMRIVDLQAGEGRQSNLAWNNAFLIVATQWDDNTRALTLTPERFDPYLSLTAAQARYATESAAHLV